MNRRKFLTITSGTLLGAAVASYMNGGAAMASPTHPMIALSFDDGPDPINTPHVLDILDAEGVKATFFLTGANAWDNQAIVQRIHDEGHVIGNHSYSHADFSTLNYTDAFNEILGTNQIIEGITGVAPTLFRYPYGISSTAGDLAIANLYMGSGIKWHWEHYPSDAYNDSNPFVGDWEHGNTTRAMADYVIGNAEDQAIILLHDGGDASGSGLAHFDYLSPMIKILKSDGFEFGVVEYASSPNPVNQYTNGDVALP